MQFLALCRPRPIVHTCAFPRGQLAHSAFFSPLPLPLVFVDDLISLHLPALKVGQIGVPPLGVGVVALLLAVGRHTTLFRSIGQIHSFCVSVQ